jgi:fructose-1,6-bisphosphatase/inositol monophosphatase family enzyme
MRDPDALLNLLLALHAEVRDEIVTATERQGLDRLAAIDRDVDGDTIYAIDVVGETIVTRIADALTGERAVVMVAEGLPGGTRVYPSGADDASADCCIIVDPIDGTRGLMYQKRSAWILTAVAPYRGPGTSLRDIDLAVQTEIPLVKQHLSDQLWAVRGGGAHAQRHNRLTGERLPIRLRPSAAPSIAHGYATIVRFFPSARDELAAIGEAIVYGALGAYGSGKTHCFEDQYASTGGQLYELMAGHDRFIADLRPLLRPVLAERGLPPALTCHPYDICCALIAEESGVIVTDAHGQPLDAPLNVHSEVAWAGYANAHIRSQVEPLLQQALRARGWIDDER